MSIETKVTLAQAPQTSVGVTLSSGREVRSTVRARGEVSLVEVPQKVGVQVSRSTPEVKVPTVRKVVVNTQSAGSVGVNIRFGGASAPVAGVGTVTSVSVTTANGISGTVADPTSTPAITLDLGDITPTSVAASGSVTGANLSGTNTGDQTNISGNAATATLAATVTTNANLTGPVTSVGNATSIANGAISNAMLANSAVASLSGTNTGDQTNISGNAATVTTNANLTGDVTSVGNAATVKKITETSGPTTLTIGTITDGQFLKRVGATLVSATPSGTGDVVGPATATDGVPALFDGVTGKLIKNSTPTGTGNPVLQTSPALVTPALGTVASGNIAATTGLVVSLTSNFTTTLATNTDTGLSFAVGANEVWFIDAQITFTTPVAGTKVQISAPTSSTTEVQTEVFTGAVASQARVSAINSLVVITSGAELSNISLTIRGTVTTGANSGTVAIGFASTTAGQTTTVISGSAMLKFKK